MAQTGLLRKRNELAIDRRLLLAVGSVYGPDFCSAGRDRLAGRRVDDPAVTQRRGQGRSLGVSAVSLVAGDAESEPHFILGLLHLDIGVLVAVPAHVERTTVT